MTAQGPAPPSWAAFRSLKLASRPQGRCRDCPRQGLPTRKKTLVILPNLLTGMPRKSRLYSKVHRVLVHRVLVHRVLVHRVLVHRHFLRCILKTQSIIQILAQSPKRAGTNRGVKDGATFWNLLPSVNSRLVILLSILVVCLGGPQRAVAQGTYAVSITECTCSPPTTDNPACCEALIANATCVRIDDPVVTVNPGLKVHLDGPPNDCPNCCKYTPDECPGNDMVPEFVDCTPSLTFSFTNTYMENIGTHFGASAIVETALETAAGVSRSTQVTCSVACPVKTPKCHFYTRTPWLDYAKDRQFSIRSRWKLSGTWTTKPMSGSCGCTLTIWNIVGGACGDDTSSITASVCTATGCTQPMEKRCETFPCN